MQKEEAETAKDLNMPETNTDVVAADKMLSYPPATCIVDDLRSNGPRADERHRRISLERLNTKMVKRRQSLPVLPSYITIYKDKRSTKKERKEVTFPLGVLLQQVVTEGEVDELKELIAKHGKKAVEEREPNALPPIMRAIFEDQMECLEVLLDGGADPTAQDPEEWNGLHVAAAMNNMEAAKLVLEAGGKNKAMTQVRNVNGERPIDLAESLEMAQFLLDTDLAEFRLECVSGDDFHIKTNETEILLLVKDYCKEHSNLDGLDEMLRENTSYHGLLHLAATKNYPRLAYSYMKCPASLEARNSNGWTALHTAAYFNNLDMVLLLIERGANIHTITPAYEKPSDFAEHELILEALLDGQQDFNLMSSV